MPRCGANGSKADGSEDRESTLPDVEDAKQICALVEIIGGVGSNVVQTSAEDAQGNRPQRDVHNHPRLRTPGDQASVSQPQRNTNPQQDKYRVGVEGQIEGEPVQPQISQPCAEVNGAPLRWWARDTFGVHEVLFSALARCSCLKR